MTIYITALTFMGKTKGRAQIYNNWKLEWLDFGEIRPGWRLSQIFDVELTKIKLVNGQFN